MKDTIAPQSSPFAWNAKTKLIAAIGAIWIIGALFLIPPAGFSIDDYIYTAMIDAFANHGTFLVENGYTEHRVDALRLLLLRDVDGQLTAQYPGGWGIIASPAYLIAGLSGVMALNAIACALTLWLVWQIAWSMFGDRQLAAYAALLFGLATFAVDYAWALWPHGVAIFCVAAATAAITKNMRETSVPNARLVFLAGLILGIGANIRVDALFAAAPICVWLLGATGRPYRSIGVFLAGLIPGLIAATVINWLKFGIASPLTYGVSEGGATFSYFAQLAPIVFPGILVAVALGLPRVRAIIYQPRALAIAAIAAFFVVVLIPPLRELSVRILNGAWILLVDFQALPAPHHGMTEMEDGTFLMWGLIKKALFQSMPYLAISVILIPRLLYGPDRSALTLCCLVFGITAMPFLYGNWHGGQASNMRYFANSLPVLVILAAAALRQVEDLMRGGTIVALVSIIAILAYGALWPLISGFNYDFVAQSTLPNALVAALAIVCIVVLLSRGNWQAIAARALFGLTMVAIMNAVLCAWFFDLSTNFRERFINHKLAELTADLPANALLITNAPVRTALRVNNPPALVARISVGDMVIDPSLSALVTSSLKGGRPVFIQGRQLLEEFQSNGLGVADRGRYEIPDPIEVFELSLPGTKQTGSQ